MMFNKQKMAHFLRAVRLRVLADKLMFLVEIVKTRRANQEFAREHPDFPLPPARLAFDAYHHTNWRAYFESGIVHARLIGQLLQDNLQGENLRVCEWGCGPGRIIRHISAVSGISDANLYGMDYNPRSIRWCTANLQGINFSVNDLSPPVGFTDNFFDCVYAHSVFTHLSEKMHFAWVEELSRIIRPGGIMIITTQGDRLAQRLLLATEKARYDKGLLVVRGKVREGTKIFSAFHPPGFVRDNLLKSHKVLRRIVDIVPEQLEQEVWVARVEKA